MSLFRSLEPTPSVRRNASAAFALVLSVAAIASSCAPRAGGGRGGFGAFKVPVEVAAVRSQTVRDAFHAVGTIEADANAKVVSEVAATVLALPFIEGQATVKGAVLAQLDDREFRADAQRTEAQHQLAATNFERAQKLFAQHVVSQSELDDSKAALAVAEANASLARVRLEKTQVRAPFDGVVSVRLVSVGTYLHVGDAITEIADLGTLKVTFAAPERLLDELKSGRTVFVSTPAFPSETFEGRVSVVDPILDPDSRTVRLTARIPNRGGKLRPGLSADVSVSLAERLKALTIPDEAVFAEGSQSFVYVVKPDSSVARTAIQIGSRDSMRVEVVKGLSAGERVVSAGHQKLFPGAHILPIGDEGAGGPGAGGPGGGKGKP